MDDVREPGPEEDERKWLTCLPSCELRVVPDDADVPGLIDVAWRTWPRGLVISVSAHGLWRCTRQRQDYDVWFRGKVAEWDLVEGVHFVRIGGSVTRDYIRATTADRLVHLSRAGTAIEARRIISEAMNRLEELAACLVGAGHAMPFMDAGQVGAQAAIRREVVARGTGSTDVVTTPMPVVREHAMGGRTVQAVSARDLHEALELKTQYGNWFDEQIVKATLVEGRDYANMVFKPGLKKSMGRPRKERIITFEAAKRIGMMTLTKAGDRIRLYFLDCEYRMMNHLGPPDPTATITTPGTGSMAPGPVIEHGDADHHDLPVGMAEFLVFKGLNRTQANAATRMHQSTLLQAMQERGPEGRVRRHPFNKRWLFRQDDLEAWWKARKGALLAIGR